MEIEVRRRGISGLQVQWVVFLVLCFVFLLFVDLLPENIVGKYDNIISIAAVVVIVSGELLAEYIMDRMYGETQQLLAAFDEKQCVLRKGQQEWKLPYSEITSVTKVMVMNQFREKGIYRVTIRRKGHRSLTFWSTEQEYREHADFEDTQLHGLYWELKSRGVKCC